MSTTAAPVPTAAPESEQARRDDLRRMKARATGLLVIVALVWIALLVWTGDQTWAGYAIAAAEAGMVGGLADWFAVTAVFRHPLGLPIPHTAVVASRKDAFGVTLGQFVQENFLSPDVVGQRLGEADLARRAGRWLTTPANARLAAGHLAELVARLAAEARDEDAISLIESELRRRVEEVDAAPAAGRLLRILTVEGHHEQLLDELLEILDRFLLDAEPNLRRRFTAEAPWWLPEPVDEAIFQRLFQGVRNILADASGTATESHGLRPTIHAAIEDFVTRLEYDPVLAERAEDLKRELLESERVRAWISSIWDELKQRIQAQAAQPESVLRTRLEGTVIGLGRRLLTDPATADRVDDLIVRGARAGVETYREELAGLVSGTIERWDTAETSDRLELLLGRDLQFIRINGTVVGALAGLVIHAIAVLT
ncbi:DUF445 domain-containing protein [Euzebya sp.]|uniref:DUF445 domain-containing protein n=1 Tax=Euzebya sp. TaxID=1971409 RepID=UPI0035170834